MSCHSFTLKARFLQFIPVLLISWLKLLEWLCGCSIDIIIQVFVVHRLHWPSYIFTNAFTVLIGCANHHVLMACIISLRSGIVEKGIRFRATYLTTRVLLPLCISMLTDTNTSRLWLTSPMYLKCELPPCIGPSKSTQFQINLFAWFLFLNLFLLLSFLTWLCMSVQQLRFLSPLATILIPMGRFVGIIIYVDYWYHAFTYILVPTLLKTQLVHLRTRRK